MKTVLVVDDEFSIVDVLVAALSDEGYRAVSAADGKQGLQRLAECRPDLVLLDFMMPRLDGPGMAKSMRSDANTRDIPIVMMSGVPEASVRPHFSEYALFLRKPFRTRIVLDAIQRLIGPAIP
jgi:CheY-like chemotaxis protein